VPDTARSTIIRHAADNNRVASIGVFGPAPAANTFSDGNQQALCSPVNNFDL
jgi:hypothetical protein